MFVASDDSAASLWPYFLNQEYARHPRFSASARFGLFTVLFRYAAYLKDEDSCVSSLVKHFKEASFLNQNLEFEKHLIWAIQQPALPDETRTVLIKVSWKCALCGICSCCLQVTHELWKLEKRNWLVSNVRVVFSILCDLLMASSKSEKPSEVCMAAVFFCTDMLGCPETGRTFQGEFYDVMQVRQSAATRVFCIFMFGAGVWYPCHCFHSVHRRCGGVLCRGILEISLKFQRRSRFSVQSCGPWAVPPCILPQNVSDA